MSGDLAEGSVKVLAYIRAHTFCEFDDIRYRLNLKEGRLWDLEARYLIGVKRIRPNYKLYAM